MEFKKQPFIPMLFGGDINTYSVARAFYEEYQVKTYVFGKFPSGPSYNSNIIEYHANLKIDTDEVFMQTVRDFAAAHADKTVLTIGCGDSYVALCSRHKDEMPENVVAPYIDFELMDRLQDRKNCSTVSAVSTILIFRIPLYSVTAWIWILNCRSLSRLS